MLNDEDRTGIVFSTVSWRPLRALREVCSVWIRLQAAEISDDFNQSFLK